MQIGEGVTLKIDSVAFGGDGVGRKDGLVFFVPFTAPGDVVDIEVVRRKKKYARGRVAHIISPSPMRIAPVCRYYGQCGGCAYQHIRYEDQLSIKQRQVQDALIKIGGLSVPQVNAIIGSPQVYGYRGKATLHAASSRDGFKLGFMDISGGRLVDIDRCEIMHESINDQIRKQKASKTGFNGADDVVLWSDDSHPGGADVLRRVKDREFLVPRDGFFQANLYLTDALVDEVCRLADMTPDSTVIDACCGAGLFSIFLAESAKRVIGVELHQKSIDYARINARRHAIENAAFLCADIQDALIRLKDETNAVDLLVLDPPRTGLTQSALFAVMGLQAAKILYVSCNPATLARDAGFLCSAGYQVRHLQPLDMFPQTQHIEIICLLAR